MVKKSSLSVIVLKVMHTHKTCVIPGHDVIIGVRPGKSFDKSKEDGFEAAVAETN